MNEAPQKLRSLARQSRTLSRAVTNWQQAEALQALAKVYEKQAQDLETPELS
jgi:hypothetical protein